LINIIIINRDENNIEGKWGTRSDLERAKEDLGDEELHLDRLRSILLDNEVQELR